MSLKKINAVLAAVLILFVLWFGTEYIVSPETTAPGCGLPSRPSGDGGGFLVVKGIRGVVMALLLAVLLLTGHRRALGWALMVEALAAYGDMANHEIRPRGGRCRATRRGGRRDGPSLTSARNTRAAPAG
ncbi:hypothetical protein GCM10017562_03830 [Streptomyces roseofulvus]|uniref:DUF4267 domain-containing protein n=1 Tax=Streptomyces roseofulvus TaxID=33902 RepID=UPI0031F9447C